MVPTPGGQPVQLACFSHCIETVPSTCPPRPVWTSPSLWFVLSCVQPSLGHPPPLLETSCFPPTSPSPFWSTCPMRSPAARQAWHPDPSLLPGPPPVHPHALPHPSCGESLPGTPLLSRDRDTCPHHPSPAALEACHHRRHPSSPASGLSPGDLCAAILSALPVRQAVSSEPRLLVIIPPSFPRTKSPKVHS